MKWQTFREERPCSRCDEMTTNYWLSGTDFEVFYCPRCASARESEQKRNWAIGILVAILVVVLLLNYPSIFGGSNRAPGETCIQTSTGMDCG